MDQTVVQRLYEEGGVSKLIIDLLCRRKRWRQTVVIDQLMRDLDSEDPSAAPSRPAVVEFFRKLEQGSFGRYVSGRRGKPSRFLAVPALKDAAFGIAGADTMIASEFSHSEVGGMGRSVKSGFPTILHRLQLRKEFTIQFVLPTDLTAAEAQRVADFIKLLPVAG